MPGEGPDLQLTSLKRKLYIWLMGLTKDNNDSFNDSLQTKQLTPDTKDIVNLLRSTGFKMVDVKIGKASSHSSLNALVCRVNVKCAKSGVEVTLESEGDCRCPDGAQADNASAWCVLPPSGSQEHLDRSGSVAGSSLLPDLPANVAELVGSATRCLLRLLEDGEGLSTPASARRSRSGSERAKAFLKRTSSGAPGDASRLGASLAHYRSLDDMQWETTGAAGGATAGTPLATPRSVRSASGTEDSVFSHCLSPALSRSEGQLAKAAVAADEASVADADADADAGEGAVAAGTVGPPRRQSTTLEEYIAFKKPLCNDMEISVTESVDTIPATCPSDIIKENVNTRPGETTGQKDLEHLPPHKAREALKKAEGAIQNMSEVMELLKKWMISDEASSSEESAGKARTPKMETPRVPAVARTSIRKTKLVARRSGGAVDAVDCRKQAATLRSPSVVSSGNAGNREGASSSARAGNGVRALPGVTKTPRTPRMAPAKTTVSAKQSANAPVANVRRRSLESPGTQVARRTRQTVPSYLATSPVFGLAGRTTLVSPRPLPPRAKRGSMD